MYPALPCPVMSCLDGLIKYYHLSLYPRPRVPVPPSCVHRDTSLILELFLKRLNYKLLSLTLMDRVVHFLSIFWSVMFVFNFLIIMQKRYAIPCTDGVLLNTVNFNISVI